jgi:hypothetical protein
MCRAGKSCEQTIGNPDDGQCGHYVDQERPPRGLATQHPHDSQQNGPEGRRGRGSKLVGRHAPNAVQRKRSRYREMDVRVILGVHEVTVVLIQSGPQIHGEQREQSAGGGREGPSFAVLPRQAGVHEATTRLDSMTAPAQTAAEDQK